MASTARSSRPLSTMKTQSKPMRSSTKLTSVSISSAEAPIVKKTTRPLMSSSNHPTSNPVQPKKSSRSSTKSVSSQPYQWTVLPLPVVDVIQQADADKSVQLEALFVKIQDIQQHILESSEGTQWEDVYQGFCMGLLIRPMSKPRVPVRRVKSTASKKKQSSLVGMGLEQQVCELCRLGVMAVWQWINTLSKDQLQFMLQDDISQQENKSKKNTASSLIEPHSSLSLVCTSLCIVSSLTLLPLATKLPIIKTTCNIISKLIETQQASYRKETDDEWEYSRWLLMAATMALTGTRPPLTQPPLISCTSHMESDTSLVAVTLMFHILRCCLMPTHQQVPPKIFQSYLFDSHGIIPNLELLDSPLTLPIKPMCQFLVFSWQTLRDIEMKSILELAILNMAFISTDMSLLMDCLVCIIQPIQSESRVLPLLRASLEKMQSWSFSHLEQEPRVQKFLRFSSAICVKQSEWELDGAFQTLSTRLQSKNSNQQQAVFEKIMFDLSKLGVLLDRPSSDSQRLKGLVDGIIETLESQPVPLLDVPLFIKHTELVRKHVCKQVESLLTGQTMDPGLVRVFCLVRDMIVSHTTSSCLQKDVLMGMLVSMNAVYGFLCLVGHITLEEALSTYKTSQQECCTCSSYEGLKVLAGASYNLAAVFHKQGSFEASMSLVRYSSDTLVMFYKSMKLDWTEDVSHQMLKRSKLGTSSALSIQNYEDALEFTAKSVGFLATSQMQSLCEIVLHDQDLAHHPAYKLVETYIKCWVRSGIAPYSSLTMRIPHLAEHEVTAVKELEWGIGFSMGKNDSLGMDSLLEDLLVYYEKQVCPIRLARILLRKASCLSKKQDTSLETRELCLKAIDILSSNEFHSDQSIQQCVLTELAVAFMQLGQSTQCLDHYTKSVESWSTFLSSVPAFKPGMKPAALDSFTAFNIDKAFKHIKQLADIFDFSSHLVSRATCLQLLLKLSHLKKTNGDCQADIDKTVAWIYSELGIVYTQLGYTGKAGIAFSYCNKLLTQVATAHQVVFCKLAYIFYLATIGNTDKSTMIFNDVMQSACILSNKESSSFFTVVLLGLAYFVRANIDLRRGSIAEALCDGSMAIKYLSKASKYEDVIEHTLLQEMNIIKTVLDVYFWMGLMYKQFGFCREADHYLKQGAAFSDKVNATGFKDKIAFVMSWLDNERQKANGIDIIDTMNTRLHARDAADRDVTVADILAKQHLFEQAHDRILSAKNIIDQAVDPKTIDSLDVGLTSLSRENPVKKPVSKSTVKPKDPIQYECSLLNGTRCKITSELAQLLLLQGKVMDAETTLSAYKSGFPSGFEKADYLRVLACIKVQKIISNMQQSLTLSLFHDTASSLVFPLELDSPRIPTKKPAVRPMTKAISQYKQILGDAFEQARTFSSPCHFYRIALDFAYLSLIQVYSAPEESLTEMDILSVCYYLETAKWLTIERDLELIHYTHTLPAKMQFPPPIDSLAVCQKGKLDADTWYPHFMHLLPRHFTVCSMSLDKERDCLYIIRYQKDTRPLVVCLPLKRSEQAPSSFSDVLDTLNTILETSNQTAQEAAKLVNKHEKQEWWKKRKSLDKQLEQVLMDISCFWMGGFKAVFGQYDMDQESRQSFYNDVNAVFTRYLSQSRTSKEKARLVIRPGVCDLFIGLGMNPIDTDIQDVIMFLLDSHVFMGKHAEYDEGDVYKLVSSMKKVLKTYTIRPIPHHHTILVLDKHVQAIPWENMACLQGQSVSRVPTLALLLQLLEKADDQGKVHVDASSTSYLLNPSGDLLHTQSEFQDILEQQWQGVCGQVPDADYIVNELKTRDIFLYFGHGSGDQYVKGHDIKALDQCAVTVLMGCSSGHLRPNGDFDPYGMALNYLLAGCPALVANLWDVTDKDIDRFSLDCFKKWGLFQPEKERVDMSRAVCLARDACQLRYLVGAAPVIYGIPVALK